MTHVKLIRTQAAGSPPALAERVERMLGEHPELDALPTAEALVAAGAKLLSAVLGAGGQSGREKALDLLAADACVTWAFEAAAEVPGTLPARAEEAIWRISSAWE